MTTDRAEAAEGIAAPRVVARTGPPGGGATTVLRASLLRAPPFPDPDTDRGEHR